MFSTRKKRLLSQLDDFDQDFIIGNTASDKQEHATANENTGDQEFTVDNPSSSLAAKENAVNVKTLERCFNERIDRENGSIVDTV